MSAEQPAAPSWYPKSRASALVYAGLAAGMFATWPTLAGLARYWADILDYEHGYIVAAITIGWLSWRRPRFDAQEPKPSPVALLALALALGVWYCALRGLSLMAAQLLVPIVLWLCVYAAAGAGAALSAAAPLAYFYFAVPLWDYLVPPLRAMTIATSEFGLRLLGVAAQFTGDLVTIPDGTFEILEGCSGKRYFVVTLAFAGVLGVRVGLTPRRHVVLFLLSVAAALIANWLRVIAIIYAGYVTHMQHYWVSVEHSTMGTVLFAILLAVELLFARQLAATLPARAPIALLPRPAAPLPAAAVLAILAVLGLGIAARQWPAAPLAGATRLGQVPLLAERWSGPLPGDRAWQPSFAGAADEARVSYDSAQGRVEVYLNLYANQDGGHKLVYYENTLLTPHDWQEVEGPRVWQSLAGAFGGAPLQSTALARSGARWALAYAYVVGGHVTASALLAQLYDGALSFGGPVGAGVVALAAKCAADCGAAHATVLEFWQSQAPELAQRIVARPPRNSKVEDGQ